ncbi:MAG TPA: DUF3471 domain-containing protein, partial [Armatimonadota bacterium]|nr:DUF3471 domain-containing protein [Armatimonadota bacterium]
KGPSRELEAYTGAYTNPAYGKLSVTLENGGLVAQWSSFSSPLEHFHFDTFVGKAENSFENAPIVFTLNADGEVAQLHGFDVDFKRG